MSRRTDEQPLKEMERKQMGMNKLPIQFQSTYTHSTKCREGVRHVEFVRLSLLLPTIHVGVSADA